MPSVLELKLRETEFLIPELFHIVAEYTHRTLDVKVGNGVRKQFSRFKFAERFLRKELLLQLESLRYHTIVDDRDQAVLKEFGNYFRDIVYDKEDKTFVFESLNYARVNFTSIFKLGKLVKTLSGKSVGIYVFVSTNDPTRYCDHEVMLPGEASEDMSDVEEVEEPEIKLVSKKRKRAVLKDDDDEYGV